MTAEKNRDIGRMTMARALEEKDAELYIQRIQGGLGKCDVCKYVCIICGCVFASFNWRRRRPTGQ